MNTTAIIFYLLGVFVAKALIKEETARLGTKSSFLSDLIVCALWPLMGVLLFVRSIFPNSKD